ncbi:MAG: VCBS repeat-containing protein [Planctomycetes bacterium]|nr:VCBS repeat-containing protein [Planctomycetota bacterium]
MTRRSVRAVLIAAGALCALTPGHAPAGPPPALRFDRVDLETEGRVTEIVPADLNGDGKRDLLVVCGRQVLVFFQGADGSWRKQAHQRFRFHPRTVLFDVGDINGDGRQEIVLLQRDGILAYQLREVRGKLLYGLRAVRLAKCPSFFTRPVKKEVRRKELLRDLDGDGALDLIVPQRDGFALLRAEGKGKFTPPVLLPAPPEAVLNTGWDRLSGRLFAAYWFPNPAVRQFDGAGPPEIVLAREGTVHVYKSPGKGALPIKAHAQFAIPEQKLFSVTVKNPLELDFTMPLVIEDIDGDGRVDVSSTHVGQGTTRLYRNKGNLAEAFTKPDLTVRAKGVTFFSYYVDLDGDKRLDLILPRIDKVNVWTILKVLVSRSVPVEMLVYYQRPDGSFESEPDFVREVDVPVALNSKGDRVRFGSSVVVAIDGDFDGDGKKDLLLREDDTTLGIYRGLAGRELEEDASTTVEVPSAEEYQFCLPLISDLDSDGNSDLILRYWSWDRSADRVVLLITKRVR